MSKSDQKPGSIGFYELINQRLEHLEDNTLSKDAIELLVVKENKSQQGEIVKEIESIYVRKSDFHKFFNALLNENPYFKGLKAMTILILSTFAVTAVQLVYRAYSFFTDLGQ